MADQGREDMTSRGEDGLRAVEQDSNATMREVKNILRRLEDRFGQDQAVGRHHGGIQVELGEGRLSFRIL